jgi:hypothetical protein
MLIHYHTLSYTVQGLVLLKVAVELFRIDGAALEGVELFETHNLAGDASGESGAAKRQVACEECVYWRNASTVLIHCAHTLCSYTMLTHCSHTLSHYRQMELTEEPVNILCGRLQHAVQTLEKGGGRGSERGGEGGWWWGGG